MTPLHRVLDGLDPSGRAHLPEDWAQGRSTFGGLVVALGLRAMRRQLPDDRRARSLLVSFVGPVEPARARFAVDRLRAGGAVTHLRATVIQRDELRCVVLGCFGAARDSALTLPGDPRPEVSGPEGLAEMPFIAGVVPSFTRHFAFRFAIGAPPFAGSTQREMGGWCRLLQDGTSTREERIAALVDAWPTPALPMLTTPAPASSLTWALDFVDSGHDLGSSADGWWLFMARAEAAAAGYVQSRGALWTPTGCLAALSRQSSAVFG